MRKIVVTRGHEPLHNGWETRSFSVAQDFVETKLRTSGMTVHSDYPPTKISGASRFRSRPAPAVGFSYNLISSADIDISKEPTAYALRADFDDQAAIDNLKREHPDEVIGVYSDPQIQELPYCGAAAVGDAHDVASQLGLDTLLVDGATGRGVRVAIVDTGIDKNIVPVSGGWGPITGYVPGSISPPQHGTMCGWDVRIAAPDAQILDFALLQSAAPNGWTGFLSDAVRAFSELINLLQQQPGPLVVNNSWGMFDRSQDDPIGSPGNYSANPNHPFNQMVGALVAAGADVCFAAGNCGADCPDMRCGMGDRGPGKSIHGANSHPDVITVAALTINRQRLGYSSQGPGGLTARKPDVAGYSHFTGSKIHAGQPDSGTSAASPVIAGVIAALRQVADVAATPPASMKGLIQRTAVDVNGTGWDYDLGYGAVDAAAAYKMIIGNRAAAAAAAGAPATKL